jgi:hypothetical protein
MVALALQVAAAFNLVCTGTQYIGETGLARRQPDGRYSFRIIYRIDLESRRWCSNDCRSTAPLVRVTDTQITFEEQADEAGDAVTTVNRESGEFLDRRRAFGPGGFVSMQTGICARAPFTSFPARRF